MRTTTPVYLSILIVCSTFATTASAQDRVRLRSGSELGEVTKANRQQVTINKGSRGPKDLPVNQIRSIIYRGEPNQLTQARINAGNGGYQNALDQLADVDVAEIDRDLIRQDVEFYKALSLAKLAINGKGKIADAGRQVTGFLKANTDSYHFYAAIEVLGDLYVAAGRFNSAVKQYSTLSRAPWPDYQARASVLVGRALQKQDKHAEAIEQFDAALAKVGTGEDGKSQRLAATLGKAVSSAEMGQLTQAVEMIEDVVRDADPEDAQLHALAYNALGHCYVKSKQPKEALLAFLHVDVLYSTVPNAHAEALENLVTLWKSLGQEGRSREAREQLREEYGR